MIDQFVDANKMVRGHTTLQNNHTTYDDPYDFCAAIDRHYEFRAKIIDAFFEKCEEARKLRRERDAVTSELHHVRNMASYLQKELTRIKIECGIYKHPDLVAKQIS